jgi:hypothetical protein
VPRGARVELPPAEQFRGLGEFTQAARVTPTGFELEGRFVLPEARLQPERYRGFVDFAARVDAAESRVAEISPDIR